MYKSACDGGRNGRRPCHLIAKLNTEIAMELQENSSGEVVNIKLWLARRRLYDKATYKQLGEEVGLSGSRVAQIVKPIERMLDLICNL